MSRSMNNGTSNTAVQDIPNGAPVDAQGKSRPPVPPKPPAPSQAIVIPAPDFAITRVKVIGIAPLICNAFPDKLLKQWEDERETEQPATKGKRKTNYAARDYQQEFENSLYPLAEEPGYGFPATAFKHAMVGACRQVDGISMELAKRLIFVMADSTSKGFNVVRLIGKPTLRKDMVRLADQKKTPDFRVRGEFKQWACWLNIKHNRAMLSVESLLNLVQIAGISEGVGENRPSSPIKTGDHGVFRIAEKGE